jgi:hypothetical protein
MMMHIRFYMNSFRITIHDLSTNCKSRSNRHDPVEKLFPESTAELVWDAIVEP